MASNDDTRFDDILQRIEDGWNAWMDALATIQDDRKSIGSMQETAASDEAAVELIRSLVDQNSYLKTPAPESVDDADSIADARAIMEHHHERLMSALDAVSEMSERVVEEVEQRIARHTWEYYESQGSQTLSDDSNAE